MAAVVSGTPVCPKQRPVCRGGGRLDLEGRQPGSEKGKRGKEGKEGPCIGQNSCQDGAHPIWRQRIRENYTSFQTKLPSELYHERILRMTARYKMGYRVTGDA